MSEIENALFAETLVELVDGRVVTRDATEWRNECLARHVLELPGVEARREWLADFEQKHGPDETDLLRQNMTAIHTKARTA